MPSEIDIPPAEVVGYLAARADRIEFEARNEHKHGDRIEAELLLVRQRERLMFQEAAALRNAAAKLRCAP